MQFSTGDPPDRAVIFCYGMLHSESFPKSHFWHFTTVKSMGFLGVAPSGGFIYIPHKKVFVYKSIGFLRVAPSGGFTFLKNDICL